VQLGPNISFNRIRRPLLRLSLFTVAIPGRYA
jgi:hypothetical protein